MGVKQCEALISLASGIPNQFSGDKSNSYESHISEIRLVIQNVKA